MYKRQKHDNQLLFKILTEFYHAACAKSTQGEGLSCSGTVSYTHLDVYKRQEIAREAGTLTVGVVTKPFKFEGKRRMDQALAGIHSLLGLSLIHI